MADMFDAELAAIARFYDARLVGEVGPLGFRRTTELGHLLPCLPALVDHGLLIPGQSAFLDLGCGDGRVNDLLSLLTRASIGIEVDEWTVEEHRRQRTELANELERQSLRPLPDNVYLFRGDATDWMMHEVFRRATDVAFDEIDIFYTFLTGHEEFAGLIAARGKPGCAFLIYGVGDVLPRYDDLELVEQLSPLNRALAVYRKPG
jgi:SAM-dependent methyltransferase